MGRLRDIFVKLETTQSIMNYFGVHRDVEDQPIEGIVFDLRNVPYMDSS